jgi:hypothetical protein
MSRPVATVIAAAALRNVWSFVIGNPPAGPRLGSVFIGSRGICIVPS